MSEFGSIVSPAFNLYTQTMALSCTMSVSLQYERSPICTLSLANEVSQMECGYLENFLLMLREVKLASEIDESTSVVVDYVMVSLTVEQKALRSVSWRYALSSYVERFNVEKCPMSCRSIGRRQCYGDTNV